MIGRFARMSTAVMAAGALLLGTLGLTAPAAQAATGDTWSGYQVVDVEPAATTQKTLLGLMTKYTGGSDDLYLWNSIRMVRDEHGNASWVYCIQQAQAGAGDSYVEDPSQAGTPASRANMEKINRVLAESDLSAPGELQATLPDPEFASPSNNVLPKNKKDHLEITAVQLAIWHYSDGLNFTASNTSIAQQFYPEDFTGSGDDLTIGEILARYDALVSKADANPLPNPQPKVSITPESDQTVAGNALFYEVTGKDIDGSITVSTSNSAIKPHRVVDGECDTDTVLTTLPADGGKVCVFSDDAAKVTITVSGKSSPNTTHPLYAYGAQGLVATGPDKVKDKAKACWMPKPKHGLEIVKTNDPDSETESAFGDTLTYNLKVTATGTAAETNVVVTDDIPGYGSNSSSIPTTYVADSATCLAPPAPDATNCAVTTNSTDGKVTSITWALGDLAPGASRTVTFKVTIDVAPSDGENPDVVLVRNCADVASNETPEVPSNCVENPVRVVTAVGDTSSSCIEDTPYFDFVSTGWFANEQVTLHILDKNGDEVETRTLTADATGRIVGHELWPGFSVDPITGVKTYPGPDLRPIKFFLSGSPETEVVTVEYPPPAEKCDAPLTIEKANTPTGEVEIGDTITYTLKVTAPANATFNQDNVVVTDYVPGHDPAFPNSGKTTYVDDSAGCTGTIAPEIGKCEVKLTKNAAGDVTKITWELGSMKPGQVTNAVFEVTVDEQPVPTEGSLIINNVGVVSSDYWPPTPSNEVTNEVVATEVLPTKEGNNAPVAPVLAETGSDLADQAAAGLGLLLLGLVLVMLTRARDPRGRPVARVSWRRIT